MMAGCHCLMVKPLMDGKYWEVKPIIKQRMK
jgi:hypothetical protein